MTTQERINEILLRFNINAKVLSERLGYDRPQVIYDIQKGKTKGISGALASKIISVFPEIDKAWLLTGEGDMLSGTVSQSNQHGDNIHGTSVTVNKTEKEYLDIIRRQAEQLSKSQQQIDRLLSIIEGKKQ